MRFARQSAKALLVILFFCEVLAAWELWRHGPLMVVPGAVETKPGEISFRLTRTLPSPYDYAALVAVIALQVGLVAFIWWFRRKITRG
jgi:hypothetical protein